MSGRLHGRRGLYPIVDLGVCDARGVDPVQFGRALLEAVPLFALQVRAKRASVRRAFDVLQALLPLARERGVPLFANDRADLAVAAGAVGVHVGQDDLPPSAVRRFAALAEAPGLLVGLSTHDRTQLLAAFSEPIDYVAIGPVSATQTKENPDPVLGVVLTRSLAALAGRPVPLVAIGGIDLDVAKALADAVDAVAVAATVTPAGDGEASLSDALARARHLAHVFGDVAST